MSILAAQNLSKTYQSGDRALKVLDDVSFEVNAGESLAIVGPSGSGKTTLLGLCAGLDHTTDGHLSLCGAELKKLDEDQRAAIRSQYVGFIFQNFQLIPTLTALENIMIPAELQGKKDVKNTALKLLQKVGLAERAGHYPSQLSGGEQQRIALARAFCNEPTILFADEPTGNLDEATGQLVEELLFQLNKEMGTTLVIVTHDLELAAKTARTIQLKGGRMVSDSINTLKEIV